MAPEANKYFDELPGSNKFQCWLCRAGLTAEDCRMVADNVGWDALADKIHVPDAGPAKKIGEANEVHMTAWLQALQDQADSPPGNKSDKEDPRPFNWQDFLESPDDDNHNIINSEEEDDRIEEIPLALENDDDEEVNKWYLFKKKEVINSL
ncbi:hypothetical protein DFH28DRAFT_1087723 [Melampsora americana]|nr:hypothetical protein DFH28DRAFT_1087723 [Melampsora americana]